MYLIELMYNYMLCHCIAPGSLPEDVVSPADTFVHLLGHSAQYGGTHVIFSKPEVVLFWPEVVLFWSFLGRFSRFFRHQGVQRPEDLTWDY